MCRCPSHSRPARYDGSYALVQRRQRFRRRKQRTVEVAVGINKAGNQHFVVAVNNGFAGQGRRIAHRNYLIALHAHVRAARGDARAVGEAHIGDAKTGKLAQKQRKEKGKEEGMGSCWMLDAGCLILEIYAGYWRRGANTISY